MIKLSTVKPINYSIVNMPWWNNKDKNKNNNYNNNWINWILKFKLKNLKKPGSLKLEISSITKFKTYDSN